MTIGLERTLFFDEAHKVVSVNDRTSVSKILLLVTLIVALLDESWNH